MEQENILSCWHKLEHFPPSLLPKGTNVKELKIDLPWNQPLPINESKNKEETERIYTIYIGVFDLKVVSDFVQKYFESEYTNPNSISSKAYYASIKLDHQGSYISNTLGIATMPWALKQLENNKIQDDSWVSDFTKLNVNLSDKLGANQDELEEDYCSYLSKVQTLNNLELIQDIIMKCVGWSKQLDVRMYYKTDEIIAKPKKRVSKTKDDEEDEEQKVSSDIINSFYRSDLETVINEFQDAPNSALTKYLKAALNTCIEKFDLSDNPNVLEDCLIPKNFPDGCWPSEHKASLMQQFAVNKIHKELSGSSQKGIFSVNGPPGTGKTTLLRDVIASILVDRAKKMIGFGDPAKAFKKIGEARTGSGFAPFIYEPAASICNGGIVVASSNNGAVENISKELPLKKEVGDFVDKAHYFRSVSESCLDKNYWGLISVVLGNKKNQRKLSSDIWMGSKKTPKSKTTLKEYLHSNTASPADWQEAVSEFKKKLKCVNAEKSRLSKLKKECAYLVRCETELTEVKHTINNHDKELKGLIEAEESLIRQRNEAKEEKSAALDEMKIIAKTKPNRFKSIFQRRKCNHYEKAIEDLLKKSNAANAILDSSCVEIKKVQIEIYNKKDVLDKCQKTKNVIALETDKMTVSCADARSKLCNSYADKSYWENVNTKASQETTPWYSDELKKLQSELFISAMNVNETFLLAANKKSGRINTSLEAFFSHLKGDVGLQKNEINALWNLFWLVVPVVSTTFASIQSMFKDLGKESIPWLFIDEAGQAVPQAAVGAIWRAKRVVVVGDPFQIEPVVTTPELITDNIAGCFNLTLNNVHSTLSVQSMADRANKYGRTINKTWIGSPLRIHRRCVDPMFTIANNIAYDGIMYNATSVPKNLVMPLQTKFIHVEGKVSTGKHYVSDQGDVIEEMVLVEINRCKKMPDLFIISPFSEVPKELKARLSKSLEAAVESNGIDLSELKKWIIGNIGTVHTFQGKQADCVILCLGLDENCDGAASWAASKPNLLNVALTRAKYCFIAVGNENVWLHKAYFEELNKLNT